MEIFKLSWFSFLRDQTQGYRNDIESKRQQAANGEIPAKINKSELEELITALKDVEKFCAEVGWKHAEQTVHDLWFELYEYVADIDYTMMGEAFRMCLKVLGRELENRFFLYVPPDDVEFYKNPLDWFSKVLVAFPSAKENVIEACRCYALDRYTACVFHCMGILQYGLYALAQELKVDLGYPLKLAEWCFIIDGQKGKLLGIEGKIGHLREDLKHLPKGTEKDEIVQFYSEVAQQFRYFKDAWRNHVAHFHDEYDKDQAHRVLIHTRDFMDRLSERISEKELPKLDIGETE
jgi:hypothetical protein